MFLKNAGIYQQVNTLLTIQKTNNLHLHCSENSQISIISTVHVIGAEVQSLPYF